MEKITKEIAQQRVEDIANTRSDDEAAHCMEDGLLTDFVRCVSEGMYDPGEAAEVAKIVLSTEEIEFSRWYA